MKGGKMAHRVPAHISRPVQKPLRATQIRWQQPKPTPRPPAPVPLKDQNDVAAP